MNEFKADSPFALGGMVFRSGRDDSSPVRCLRSPILQACLKTRITLRTPGARVVGAMGFHQLLDGNLRHSLRVSQRFPTHRQSRKQRSRGEFRSFALFPASYQPAVLARNWCPNAGVPWLMKPGLSASLRRLFAPPRLRELSSTIGPPSALVSLFPVTTDRFQLL